MSEKRSFPPVSDQMERIRRDAVDLLPEDELVAKLERSRESGEPLVVKLGFDPTRPDLHLGHTVTLRKLRDFQELGHAVTFVIGDFTALIGDPSGRSKTRPPLSRVEVDANALTFAEQVYRILDPERTTIRYNSEWLDELGYEGVLELAARYTVARMLERDDFQKRYAEGVPISIHELLYPLAQAYDSVVLEADVEVGGTDQKFNLLVGRDIQREYGQDPQVVLTLPMLEGTDGVHKMSKSLGNYVALHDAAEEMYGKTMSIPDEVIGKWFRLAVGAGDEELAEVERRLREGENPRDLKRRLARRVVETYHGAKAAEGAERHFDRLFVRHELPEEIPEKTVRLSEETAPLGWILKKAGLVSPTSEGYRMVEQGAVRWSPDGDGGEPRKIDDRDFQLPVGARGVVQVGKRRFARLELVG